MALPSDGYALGGYHFLLHFKWLLSSFFLKIQFIGVISHTGYNKFVRTDCDYPFLYNSIVFYYTISMVVLFSDFYYRTYMPHKKASAAAAKPSKERISNNNGYVQDSKSSLVANGDQRKAAEAVNGKHNIRSRRN